MIPKSDPEIKNRCTQDGVTRQNPASILKSELEIKNRCTQEGLNRQNHASILKSGPKIKNRCTQEEVNGENLASIRKSDPEIKNRCTQEEVNGENLASILKSGLEIKNRCMQQAIFSTRSLDESLWRYVGDKLEVIVWTLVRQWRQMRVLMRPEAAFPYVFAAEGAQHPPIGRHALRSPPNNSRSTIATQRSALNDRRNEKRNLYQKKSGPVFD